MKMIISAVIALLSAQAALAEQRVNKPFTTVNGRSTGSAPAQPRVYTVTKPGGGVAANVAAAPAAAPAPANHAFSGGRQVAGRSSSRGGRAVMSGGGKHSMMGRGVAAPEAPAEERPPYFDKPGALIRTTGQQPVYEKTDTSRTHTVDAGEIVLDRRKATNVGQAPSIQYGPRDTPPPPNPVAGKSYGSAISANSGGSSSGGKDNNGSGNNGKGMPGDDYDSQGGKSLQDSINDAY